MSKKKSLEMKKVKSNLAVAAVLACCATLFSSQAFAISSLEECNSAVKSATTDLLKANVKMEALGPIDAAIIAAGAKCGAEDFAGAEADLENVKAMISEAAQN